MFKCNQCPYQVDYKQNLTRHMKNKHGDNISMEKDNGKSMKNDHHKQLTL